MGLTGDRLLDLIDADWVTTRFGRMVHITAPKDPDPRVQRSTHCGRFAFDSTDSPVAPWHPLGCTICVEAERRVRAG